MNKSAVAVNFVMLYAIFAMSGCSAGTTVEEYAKSFPVSGRTQVHVRASNAQIRVVTSNEDKVDFHVRYELRDGASVSNPFTAHQDGSLIELTSDEQSRDWWGWNDWNVRRAQIAVRMPKNGDLQLETSNGEIEVSSVNGNIVLHTSNGRINVADTKGKLTARTSNGSINAEGLDGDCNASSSNGRIEVAGRFDALEIHSSNGGVVAHAGLGSKIGSRWSIGTSNAGVELSVPADLKAELDLGTSNGGVHVDVPVLVQGFAGKSHLHGTLNGGGGELSVHTSNGGIHIGGA